MKRLRKIVAESPRGHDLSDDAPADERLRYWRLKEVAGRLTMKMAIRRIQKAQAEMGHTIEVLPQPTENAASLTYQFRTAKAPVVREGGSAESQLDRIERRLSAIESRLSGFATRAEMESVGDSVTIAVEGYAAVDTKLGTLNKRLTAVQSQLARLELRVLRLENPRGDGTPGTP